MQNHHPLLERGSLAMKSHSSFSHLLGIAAALFLSP
jgi:hypothetical protein